MIQPNKIVTISLLILCTISLCKSTELNTVDAVALRSRSNADYRSYYAAQMLSFMNQSVEPCEDFYEYACGNWKNFVKPRQTKKRRSFIFDIEYNLIDIAEEMIQRPHIDDVAPEYAAEFKLAQQFYGNCIESDLTAMQKSTEYLKVLQNIGGFPAVDSNWNPSDFSWLNMSAHMSNYGIDSLVNEDVADVFPFTPDFDLPVIGFDIALHYDSIKDKSSNAYQVNEKRMRDILTIYNVANNQIDKIVNDVFDFFEKLLTIYEEFDENRFKCEPLGDDDPSISASIEEQWLAYYEIAWMDKVQTVDDENKPCSYLYNELNKLSDAQPEVVANYLSMKFIYHLDTQLRDSTFQKELCISKLRKVMIYLFDHLYMKIYADQETLDEVREMINDVQKSLRAILKEADWLDEETREAALQKEKYMGQHVGRYEDDVMTKRLLGELKNLEFVEGNYEANNLNLLKFGQFMLRYNGLNHDILDNTTKPLPLLVGMQPNAFYYPLTNAIYVMAGVLQPPVFHKSWPNALKYGTLGFLVGHELTHGFDTVGAKYDHVGSNNSWWSEESKSQFNDRAQCFIDQFQNFFVPEINRFINGNLTKDENIADAGGLRLAFLAYRRFVEDTLKGSDLNTLEKDEEMPGLDLSPEKLFFLASAQYWCASFSEADYWEGLMDSHTIEKYRVLGMVSNNVNFATAFNCPLGSKLNPTNKCKVW